MPYKRILTIQDISCVGQCSLTVAMPILSAMGLETCVLPTAVLSTHTGGKFNDFTFRDLTDDMEKIECSWEKNGINFDGIYTGYLGNLKQVKYVESMIDKLLKVGGKIIVDPVMGDNGQLYSGFDHAFVEEIKKLCKKADMILPNITEACLLTEIEYKETYDQDYIIKLLEGLQDLNGKDVLITGVSYNEKETGVAFLEKGEYYYYGHSKYNQMFHGTGDIFSSTFAGAWFLGHNVCESVKEAADFVLEAIENTLEEPAHWYGVRFEKSLHKLARL